MNDTNINIWSLDKEQNIKALLLLLILQVGSERFSIDNKPLPSSAIRITSLEEKPEVAVYIYTYAQPKGQFGIDLEYPILIEKEADDKTEHLNELDEAHALEIIINHLELFV